MNKVVVGLCIVVLFGTAAQAAITWSAEFNSGKDADYTVTGIGTAPWSGSNTTAWSSDDGRGGSGCVESLAPGQLSYASQLGTVLNVSHGTISMWFKPNYDSTTPYTTYNGNDNPILNLGTGQGDKYNMVKLCFGNRYHSNRWVWYWGTGSTYSSMISTVGNTFEAGDWINFTLTWNADGGILKMYVNGELSAEKTGTTWYNQPWALAIGNLFGASTNANGWIDSVKISDTFDDATLIPEPGTAAVILVGAGLTSLRRRNR
ncbi:MAG: PEP-CTERM sorting domain-containing protein [Planctomycetes bacterium]|nr:PEP-CTERM sorting domain-containing protein [Planctomycetota bacterium]